jgi:uncharacterized membrane protein
MTQQASVNAERQGFIDVFRGLLITHMAFDHASLMFNAGRGGEELWGHAPEFPSNLWQFLARFSGVMVAPGFCMMAGFMVAWTCVAREARGVPSREITKRLLIRGLVLIAVDTVVGGLPRLAQGFYSFMVLSCIGVSIIIVALLRHLSSTVLLTIALLTLLLHPLLDTSELPLGLRLVLHEPIREGHFRSLYPLIPWFSVLLLGFVLGRDATERKHRERFWLGLAALSLAFFFVVRFVGYGNAYSHAGVFSRSFWYFAKYPPDLPFLAWAFVGVFSGLAAVHRLCRNGVPRLLRPLVVYGQVSFFFYVVHFYVLGFGRALLKGRFGLLETTGVWLVLLLLMYWLCRAYGRKKQLRPNFITRYL